MDLSIRLITPEIMREFGAHDYDRGVPFDGHNMNPGAPAIADWQAGWLQRERVVMASRELMGCPP